MEGLGSPLPIIPAQAGTYCLNDIHHHSLPSLGRVEPQRGEGRESRIAVARKDWIPACAGA